MKIKRASKVLSPILVIAMLISAIAVLEPPGAQAALTDVPPVADAGGPYSGSSGDVLTLDGSGSYDPVEVTDEVVGTGDGAETEFALDYPPVEADSEIIKIDGIQTTDYTIDYATGQIVFDSAPGATEVTGEAVGTGDGATTNFTLDDPPVVAGSEIIYVDGVINEAYTIDYATGEIVFDSAPGHDNDITADYQAGEAITASYTGRYDLASWDWDYNNDTVYDDASGETPEYTCPEYSNPITSAVTVEGPCTDPTISWTYRNATDYTVSLQVTDEDQNTDTDNATVTVSNPQVLWEVEVWTTPGGHGTCMWDPQVGAGTDTSMAYAGLELDPDTVYYARVRTNDGTNWSAWSETDFSCPRIEVSPSEFYAELLTGWTTGPMDLWIVNTGLKDLDFTLSNSEAWLTLSESEGTADVVEPNFLVQVTIDSTGLSEGCYHDEIVITSNDPNDNPVIVPVHLEVYPWIEPVSVDDGLYPGQSIEVNKTLLFEDLPEIDLFFLVDDTDSFAPHLADLRTLAPDIFYEIQSLFPDSEVGLGAFRDFPTAPWGGPGDFPYDLYLDLTADGNAFSSALLDLNGMGAGDPLESQYEALYRIAGPLYAVDSSTDSLYMIDPASGVVTLIGPLDPDEEIYTTPVAMAVDPADGTIYVWNNTGTTTPNGALLMVDPDTGLATIVGTPPSEATSFGALAFAADGTLYGIGASLYEIDTTTGAVTEVGSLGGSVVYAAAFDASGTLYGVDTDGNLVTINTATGAATVVDSLSEDIGTIGSIVFNAAGTLIGSGFGGASGDILFDIDPATAVVSNIRTAEEVPQGMGFSPSGAPSWCEGSLRVVVLVTNSGFHNSDDGSDYPGAGAAETIAALQAAGITVIGLDSNIVDIQVVAGETGGVVIPLNSAAADVAQAILNSLGVLTYEVVDASYSNWVDLSDSSFYYNSYWGVNAADFVETITVPIGTDAGEHSFVVHYGIDGVCVDEQTITIEVLDNVKPEKRQAEIMSGDYCQFRKSVFVPPLPETGVGGVDVVLLEDETGSFWDDIATLQSTAPSIFDSIRDLIPDSMFGVAGFQDYPIGEFGLPDDVPWRMLQDLTYDRDAFLDAVNSLTAISGSGNDTPESQWEALLQTALNFSWRPGAQPVIIIATDAGFHEAGDMDYLGNVYPGPYSGDVIDALNAAGIVVIGIESGHIPDVHYVADATGGVVQEVGYGGEGIAQAILDGLTLVLTYWDVVEPVVVGADPLEVSFDPDAYYGVAGDAWLRFDGTISVPAGTPDGVYDFTVEFRAYRDAGGEGELLAVEEISITVFSVFDWVMMVYMAADNDLGDCGPAGDILDEIEDARRYGPVRTVVLYDGYDYYGEGDSVILDKACWKLREVDDEGAVIPLKTGEVNMGDPDTLENFINWVKANYPSQNYGLILWDHGKGWRTCNLSVDWTDDDSLSLRELGQALSGATSDGADPLQLVGFDACLMQMLEVDYQIAPYAEYAVGSEEVEPWGGWPYERILSQLARYRLNEAKAAFVLEVKTNWPDAYAAADEAFMVEVRANRPMAFMAALDAFELELETKWPDAYAAANAAYNAVIDNGGTIIEARDAYIAELETNWADAYAAANAAFMTELKTNWPLALAMGINAFIEEVEANWPDALAAAQAAYDAVAAVGTTVMSAEELASMICRLYERVHEPHFYHYGFPWYTMSAKDLSMIAPLVNAVDAFAAELMAGLGMYDEAIANARAATQTFGHLDEPFLPPILPLAEEMNGVGLPVGSIDLYHFAELIAGALPDTSLATAAVAVMTAIDDAVIYNVAGEMRPNANGIAIYYPDITEVGGYGIDIPPVYNGYEEPYGMGPQFMVYEPCYDVDVDFAVDTLWSEYIKRAPRLVNEGTLLMYIPDVLILAHINEDPIIRIDTMGGYMVYDPEFYEDFTVMKPVDIIVTPEGTIDLGIVALLYSQADLDAAGILKTQLLGASQWDGGQWALEKFTMDLPTWLFDMVSIFGSVGYIFNGYMSESMPEEVMGIFDELMSVGPEIGESCGPCVDYVGAVIDIPWLDLSNIAPYMYEELPDLPAVSSSQVTPLAIIATNQASYLTPIQYPQNLYDGWNAFSLPVIPLDGDVATILSGHDGVVQGVTDDVEVIWSYDAATGEWYGYSPAAPEASDLYELKDGMGYWALMNGDATMTVLGSNAMAGPSAPPEYDLVEGWNFLGYKGILPMTPQGDSYYYEVGYVEGEGWEEGWGYYDFYYEYYEEYYYEEYYYEEWYEGEVHVGGYLEEDKVIYNRLQGYNRIYDTFYTPEFLFPNDGYWIYVSEAGSIPGLNDEVWVDAVNYEYYPMLEATMDWIGFWMMRDGELGLRLAWNALWYAEWVVIPGSMGYSGEFYFYY